MLLFSRFLLDICMQTVALNLALNCLSVNMRVSGRQEKDGGISFRGRSKWRPCGSADDGRPQFFVRGLRKTLKESLFCCQFLPLYCESGSFCLYILNWEDVYYALFIVHKL